MTPPAYISLSISGTLQIIKLFQIMSTKVWTDKYCGIIKSYRWTIPEDLSLTTRIILIYNLPTLTNKILSRLVSSDRKTTGISKLRPPA